MPRGSKAFSADQVQLVAQANRLLSQERKRQQEGGEQATEAGAVALHYADRELVRIYGYNSGVQKLSLSGVEDPTQVQKILDAAERIAGSKMLSAKGRAEAHAKAAASFFGVDRGKLTAKQRKIYRALTESKNGAASAFDRLKESAAGYAAGSIKDAVQQMVENGLTGNQITEAIEEYVSYASAAQNPDSIYDYLDEKYPDMDWGEEK